MAEKSLQGHIFVTLDRFLSIFQKSETPYFYLEPQFILTVTWKLDILKTSRPKPPSDFFWAAVTIMMFHNTLKSNEPSEHSPRSTHSAAQRRLWRYSGCRRAGQVESHRRSVCVLAADLNGGEGQRGGGGVIHTIHGLCHLCIGCRLPQVCLCFRE